MRNYADRTALTDIESLAGPRPRARAGAARELSRLDDAELFRMLPTAAAGEHEHIREELVTRHSGLVRWLAAQYAHPGVEVEELRQVGFLGLVAAINRFDPQHGSDFVSFARPTVQGEIRRWFRDKRRWIRLPRRLQEAKATLRSAQNDLLHRLGREPSRAELAEHTGLSIELVAEALDADDTFTAASLDAPTGTGDGDDTFTIADTLGIHDERFDLLLDCQALRGALAVLDERDRRILHLRFFEELTQVQIAEALGCSQMHVSRLLARTLTRLRKALTEPDEQDLSQQPALAA